MKGRTREDGDVSRRQPSVTECCSSDIQAQTLKIEKFQQAAAIVVNDLPAIMKALVEKAKEGSYLHAKCVFELARISEIELPKVQRAEPWVEELLGALRALPDPTEPVAAS